MTPTACDAVPANSRSSPRPRHGCGVNGRCRAVLGACGALFGRGEQFERETVSANADGVVVFGLGAVGAALFERRRYIAGQLHLGAQLGALAVLGVANGSVARRAGRALFGFLGLDRDGRSAKLALQVRGAGLDSVQLGARFVGQIVGDRQLGHPAAFLRLAFAKLAGASFEWESWESSPIPGLIAYYLGTFGRDAQSLITSDTNARHAKARGPSTRLFSRRVFSMWQARQST